MRHVDAQHGYQGGPAWKAFNIAGWHEIGDEAYRNVVDRIEREDAYATDFQLAANCGGRGCAQDAAFSGQQNLIIGDETRRLPPQCVGGQGEAAQCEVRFAGSRRAANEHGGIGEGDAGCVEVVRRGGHRQRLRVRRHDAPACG